MALHHHCCHHHSSTTHCTHHQHATKQHNNVFRSGAGHGVWLPALLPAACICGSLTDASLSHHISRPLMLLVIQSCVYCFFLAERHVFSKSITPSSTDNELVSKRSNTLSSRPLVSASSKTAQSSCENVTPNSKQTRSTQTSRTRVAATAPTAGAQRRGSLFDRSADAVASLWGSNARARHPRQDALDASPMSQRAVMLHFVTIMTICLFSETGLLAAIVASIANLCVQAVVSRWLLQLHSSTFSPGEWLMAGQFVGVSVGCSLLSLLSPCPREVAYTACQLNTFLQLSVVLSASLLLLFLALPPSHNSSPFVLLPLTFAVGGAGVLWASLMLGEFVPLWLTRQILAGDGNWSMPVTNASGCSGASSSHPLSGRAEAAWWFGSGNTNDGGLKTWWGGGRNSWYAYLFGGRESSAGAPSWWWRWLRGGNPKESWLSYIIGGGFLWGTASRDSEHVGGVVVVGWRRPLLLLWWTACSFAAWLATRWVHRYQHVSVSVVRKLYHLVAVLVFVAGILWDPPFLKLATVAATIACLMMEVVRVLKVPGVSALLTNAFASFLDEKDSQGTLILSHIYLLVGLSLPLWIPNIPSLNLPPRCSTIYSLSTGGGEGVLDNANDLLYSEFPDTDAVDGIKSGSEPVIGSYTAVSDVACWCGPTVSAMLLLAGVLSVGIGDTFASVGGIRFGKHKWPRSKKSIEGTVCGVVAQILLVVLLVLGGGVVVTGGGAGWWCGVLATMVVCGVVEALTDQVDNLVLPLLMFCGISLTEYIAS